MSNETTEQTEDASTTVTLPRETGSEKSVEECPNCGGDLPLTTTPYKSVIAGECPKCGPGDKPRRAAKKTAKKS